MPKSLSREKHRLPKNNLGKVKANKWEGAISDAEERIAHLKMSIEVFRDNIRHGLPFPGSGGQSARQN
jgi:hypothetical protein